MSDWNSEQYHKFQQERSQPAYDLMEFVGYRNRMRIVDLGCGTGEHTKTLHERFRAMETIGIDSSDDMLAKVPRTAGLKFYKADIQDFAGDTEFDLVFSNAALQWVPDHETLFANFKKALRPGGQLAIQVPKNGDHPSQRVAYELEKEAGFSEYPPNPLEKNTLAPQGYAQLLYKLGYQSIRVKMNIYLHELASAADTVEWMKGSLLTHYRSHMPEDVYQRFLEKYTERTVAALPKDQPYLYTFKRILMHAVRP